MGITSPLDPVPVDHARHPGRHAARDGRRLRHAGQRRHPPQAAGHREGRLPQRPRRVKPKIKGKRVLSAGVAYAVTKILEQNTTRAAPPPPCPPTTPASRAGKTGTTDNSTDAWFCGFNPEARDGGLDGLLDQNTPMYGVHGATYCVPIWGKFYNLRLRPPVPARLPAAGGHAHLEAVEGPLLDDQSVAVRAPRPRPRRARASKGKPTPTVTKTINPHRRRPRRRRSRRRPKPTPTPTADEVLAPRAYRCRIARGAAADLRGSSSPRGCAVCYYQTPPRSEVIAMPHHDCRPRPGPGRPSGGHTPCLGVLRTASRASSGRRTAAPSCSPSTTATSWARPPVSRRRCDAIVPLAPYADTLMLTRGVLRTASPPRWHADRAARLGRQQRARGRPLQRDDHHRRSRSASGSTPPAWRCRSSSARRTSTRRIANLGKLVDEGERYGIPVLGRDRGRQGHGPRRALPRARLPHRRRDGRAHRQDLLLRGLREGVTGTCPVPVVMAGGKKLPEREALELTCERDRRRRRRASTWAATSSSPTRPVGMIKAVRAVVHENATVDDAFAVYRGREGRLAALPSGRRGRRRLDDAAQDLGRRDADAMRVAVYYNNADIRVEERPVPADRAGRDRSCASGRRASAAPT